MYYCAFLGAAALFGAGADAALGSDTQHDRRHDRREPAPTKPNWGLFHRQNGQYVSHRYLIQTLNGTSTANSTVAWPTGYPNTTSWQTTTSSEPTDCPLSVVTATTTVDITVYITALDNTTSTSSTSPGVRYANSSTTEAVTTSPYWHAWNTTTSGYLTAASPDPSCSENHTTHGCWASPTQHTTSTTLVASTTATSDPGATSTEPCEDDLSTTSASNSNNTSTGSSVPTSPTTTPCDENDASTSSAAASPSSTSSTYPTSGAGMSTSEPCDTDEPSTSSLESSTTRTTTISLTAVVTPTSSSVATVDHHQNNTSYPTYPTYPPSSSSSSSSEEPTSSSSTMTTTTTTCVIDTTMEPVTTASVTSTQTATLTATGTICATDAAATGTPKPRNVYCGVHGVPVGNYFLAQYVQNKADVPVTLEGCHQFCKANFEAVGGCRSYDFHLEPGLDVPRCDLYGSSVAFALRSIDNYQPHWWFDLECGDQLDPAWHIGHAAPGHDHVVDGLLPIWRRRGTGGERRRRVVSRSFSA